jgi:hypothetical protein
MADDDEKQWLVAYRGFDPAQLALTEALLASADIRSRRLGAGHAALLGAGDSAIIQLISVPAADLEEAQRLLRDAELGQPVELVPEEPEDDNAGADESVPRRTRFVSVGMTALWPGLGLAYAGWFLPGLGLAVWSFAAHIRRDHAEAFAGIVFGHVVARLVDLGLAQSSLTRHGGRHPHGWMQQVLAAVLLVTAMHWSMKFAGVPVARYILAEQSSASPPN